MSDTSFATTLAWAAFASCAPLVALLLPLVVTQLAQHVKSSMLASTAGMLLAISTLDLIPEAVNMGHPESFQASESHLHGAHHAEHAFLHAPLIGVALGFVGLYLMERMLNNHGHFHDESLPTAHAHHEGEDEKDRSENRSPFSTVALIAVILHSFLDGLVIAGVTLQ